MIRRKFLADRLPTNIERFKRHILTEWLIDNVNCIEKFDNQYKITFFDNNRMVVNDADEKVADKFIKQNKLEASIKTRFYVPLTSILNAKVDIYDDVLENTISVDFFDSVEADNFEIPSWFGAELTPELMVKKQKTKRKSK